MADFGSYSAGDCGGSSSFGDSGTSNCYTSHHAGDGGTSHTSNHAGGSGGYSIITGDSGTTYYNLTPEEVADVNARGKNDKRRNNSEEKPEPRSLTQSKQNVTKPQRRGRRSGLP